jgi:AcrR family transcriptional regulator
MPTDDRTRELRLSAGIERAWGRRPRPRKGPKPGLDLDAIVASAVDLAQADGLAAVSMSRLATKLGVSTMSLYGYLDTKDELLALMVDHACGAPPDPDVKAGWRENLRQWAATLFDRYRRHRWAAQIAPGGVPPTPTQIAWLEAGLHCLKATGVSEQQRISTVLLISVLVRAEAALALDLDRQATTADGEPAAIYGRILHQLIDPDRYPEVWAAANSGAFDDQAGLEREFTYGLDRILDGLHLLINQTQTNQSAHPPTNRRKP